MATKNNLNIEKDRDIIRVHQEDLDISKKVVETGKIRIHKTIHTETVNNDISLLYENIRIDHIKINKEISEIPKIRKKGNVTIIPVIEEMVVVTKKIMLLKEIHVTKEQSEKLEHIKSELRKDTVTIDKKNKKTSK